MINTKLFTLKSSHAMLCTSFTVLLAACGGGSGGDTTDTETLAHRSKSSTPSTTTAAPAAKPTSPAATTNWTACASEWSQCSFSGTKQVRYGAQGTYVYKTATDSIKCTNDVFGDPLPTVTKACDYAPTTPATTAPATTAPATTAPATTAPATTAPTPTTTGTYHDTAWRPSLKAGPARTGEYFMKEGETLTGGSINCSGLNWCVHMANNSTLDGVEVFGTKVSTYGAAIEMNQASNAQVINSYIHDVGSDGLMCNTDTGPGMSNNLVQNNRFVNIGRDAMHFKGTNADWKNGAWIPSSQQNKNHKIIGNVSINTWRNGGGGNFSYELQDGQVDMVIQNNYADATYSLVGHIGSSQLGGNGRVQITGNYVKPTDGNTWGFEIGNVRGSDVKGNTFDGSSASVVNTGNTDQKNANNTYGPNTFINGANKTIHLNWDGGGNVANSPDIMGSAW